MNNVPKPEISPYFTIDDIHKISEWHILVARGRAYIQNENKDSVSEKG
jgi:hypothetical protein